MSKPKRKFWQFHLSTCIILMFSAGLFLELNTIRNDNFAFQLHSPLKENFVWGDVYQEYGWPFSSYSNVRFIWRLDRMLLNIGICCLLLFIVAILCERFIRRREGRKR